MSSGQTRHQGKKDFDGLQSGRDGRVWTEFVDEVAIIRFDCGENRFNEHFLSEVNRCLDEVLQRPHIKAVVTSGTNKFYSNGLDLNWMTELGNASKEDLATFIRKWNDTLQRILVFPLPTVAAINGHAFAGGAFLSLCHDYRAMQSGRGWFSINEVHLGMQIPQWLIKLATFKIPGSKATSDILIYGKRVTAEEALKHGVIHKVSTPESLLQDAINLAKDSVAKAPNIQRDMIQLMKVDTYAEILAHIKSSVKNRISKL